MNAIKRGIIKPPPMASKPSAEPLPPVSLPARKPSALEAYAAHPGSAVDKVLAVQLAGGTAVVRTIVKTEVLTVDGIAAAQVADAAHLLKLRFKAPEADEIKHESGATVLAGLGRQSRVISGTVDSVTAYDVCTTEGHEGYQGYPDDYKCRHERDFDFPEPRDRVHEVAVTVAGTLSVRAPTAGAPGPRVALVPFTASLSFYEACTQHDYSNHGCACDHEGELRNFEFTVTFPDDGVLTKEEIALLKGYEINNARRRRRRGGGGQHWQEQIGTKSIILQALANRLIRLNVY